MVKPTFLIAGAMKAGTTSLYSAVRSHPEVGRATRKELHFFDRHYDRGMDWYEDQFRLRRKQTQVGEGTPVYMYDRRLRKRIARDLPDIRLIVSLRDPIKRSYSHFWHSKRYDREELSTFEEALAAEPERLATAKPRWRYRWSYLDRSRYIDQLADLENLFGRERICVVTLEELKVDPDSEIGKVLEFLGLDPLLRKKSGLPVRNTFNEDRPITLRERQQESPDSVQKLPPSSYPPLNPETRSRLMEEFQPYDARLKEWLGRSTLPWESLANE
ncbi:MAG: sulfotransferase domain-containing protein [Actinomycetia bacterium]|nr:sulfotransferase domain-containing protein [Actinomycetes bacterium]